MYFWRSNVTTSFMNGLLFEKNRLAGFFPIHKYGGQAQDCGEIQKEDGIQPLEAMLYTLDEINKNDNILPGIRLGAIGNEKSLNFMFSRGTHKFKKSLETACDLGVRFLSFNTREISTIIFSNKKNGLGAGHVQSRTRRNILTGFFTDSGFFYH